MIIIINPVHDYHCQYMAARLARMGAPYMELGCPIRNDYALLNGWLYYNGIPVPRAQAVFYRGVLGHNAEPVRTDDAEKRYTDGVQFAARAEAVQSWLAILAETGVNVINPPGNRSKYVQLHTLLAAGLPLPRTCITSSPELAARFIESVGAAVCKPARGGSYCRKIGRASCRERV